MRIVRVITRLDVHGGAEVSTLLEVDELNRRGHRVAVVTVTEPPSERALEILSETGTEHRHLSGNRLGKAHRLRRLLGTWRPDLIHAVIFEAEMLSIIASAGLSVPVVVSLVNTQYGAAARAAATSPWKLEVARRLEGLLLRVGARRFHTLTEAGARHAVEHLEIPRQMVTVIPRGRRSSDLSQPRTTARAARADLGIAAGDRLLLNVGRHETQKGQDLLLRALADEALAGGPYRCVIAGREGNRTPHLVRLARELGIDRRVRFLGFRPDVPALFAAADAVCVTSRWEGMGGAIVEALGAGAPIVTFATPAVEEVVGDAAILVQPFDTSGYAAAVAGLVEDGRLRAELSARGRERFARRFELGSVVDRIEELYAQVAGG